MVLNAISWRAEMGMSKDSMVPGVFVRWKRKLRAEAGNAQNNEDVDRVFGFRADSEL